MSSGADDLGASIRHERGHLEALVGVQQTQAQSTIAAVGAVVTALVFVATQNDTTDGMRALLVIGVIAAWISLAAALTVAFPRRTKMLNPEPLTHAVTRRSLYQDRPGGHRQSLQQTLLEGDLAIIKAMATNLEKRSLALVLSQAALAVSIAALGLLIFLLI